MVKIFRVLPNETSKINEVNEFIAGKYPVVSAIYMPECGHCKDLIPKWNAASQQIQDGYKGNAVIALVHMDSLNSLQLPKDKIQGYPHIMSYHGNREHEYHGERSKQNLLDFMIKNGKLTPNIRGGARKKRRSRRTITKRGKKTRRNKKTKRKKTRRKRC
jgi:hypothetical protein|uniref:Thioredoxin domain-containing protein n=1 Tax=viral metagenome TaxID=1070528 RepID=A0A6C0LU76_9ZZZZ